MSERDTSAVAESERDITLGLLQAVEENSTVTQRSVAGELGIALGLANAYLKRCVKKGLIKVKQIPPNRYAYYLTPKGFTEKSRLTAEYLSDSFTFFRRARRECEELFERCRTRGWTRIALCGRSDLGEIASLCAAERGIVLAGVVEAEAKAEERFYNLPVAPSVLELGPLDAVIVTDLKRPQATYDAMRAALSEDRVLVPRLLRVNRNGGAG